MIGIITGSCLLVKQINIVILSARDVQIIYWMNRTILSSSESQEQF